MRWHPYGLPADCYEHIYASQGASTKYIHLLIGRSVMMVYATLSFDIKIV